MQRGEVSKRHTKVCARLTRPARLKPLGVRGTSKKILKIFKKVLDKYLHMLYYLIVRKKRKGLEMFKRFDNTEWTADEKANARKVCKFNDNVADVPTETLMAAIAAANDEMLCAWMCDTKNEYKRVEARIMGWYEATYKELEKRMA